MAPHARTLCVPRWLGGPNLFDTWEITGCHYLHEGEHLITVGHSSASMDVTIALGVPAGNGATGLPAAVTGLVLVCTSGIWGRGSVQSEKIPAASKAEVCRAFSWLGVQPTLDQVGKMLLVLWLPSRDRRHFCRQHVGRGYICCPTHHQGLLDICRENGANPNAGQG